MQGGPGGPKNFGWVGHMQLVYHNAFMFVSCCSVKLVKKRIYVAITAFCGFCDKVPADPILPASVSHNH